jgi:hypothetical protein
MIGCCSEKYGSNFRGFQNRCYHSFSDCNQKYSYDIVDAFRVPLNMVAYSHSREILTDNPGSTTRNVIARNRALHVPERSRDAGDLNLTDERSSLCSVCSYSILDATA